MARYTSASDMLFKSCELRGASYELEDKNSEFLSACPAQAGRTPDSKLSSLLKDVTHYSLLVTCYLLLAADFCRAEVIDGVAAFVDDVAITLSELDETYKKTGKVKPDILRDDVLDTMINRILLLNEARKLKIEAKTDDELLNEYIELKVRAFIRLKEEDLEDFYKKNISEFKGAAYESVRNKIEEYLTESEINTVLKGHVDELRSKAYVKIVTH